MIFPVLLVAAVVGFIGWNIGRGAKDPLKLKGEVVGAQWPTRPSIPQQLQPIKNPYHPSHPRSYTSLLARVISQGMSPSESLMNAAYCEAQHWGDQQTMQVIVDLACPRPASQEQTSQEPGGESEEPGNMSEYESANPDVPPGVTPLPDAATPEEWATFCGALKTKEPTWSSDKYVGCFEHNRARLRQLGLDDTSNDEESQRQALAADMQDYYQGSSKLIADFAGDVINVNGQQVPVTASGILALLKAAGPRGAESWLQNESDRTRFPRTTATFMRANNCF